MLAQLKAMPEPRRVILQSLHLPEDALLSKQSRTRHQS